MPTLDFTIERMSRLVGKKLSIDDLETDLQWISLDIEEIDRATNTIKVEYSPNRPDFSSPEGIARALKGYYDIEVGMQKWEMTPGSVKMYVDKKVRNIRPYVVCGVIRNIKLDDEQVRTVMNIQEDLHHALGRGRKKVAIGVHDFDKIKSPFKYTTVKPNEVKFRPLQMEKFEMTPEEILKEHPKGIEYAPILKDCPEYPMIFDANKNVVSFPPIINGVLTTVTDSTKNLLLDLTGTDFNAVNYSLNILATTFADMGAKIEQVELIYEDGKPKWFPDFTPVKWTIREEYINSYLGLNLTTEKIIQCLKKCRLDVEIGKKAGTLEVYVPAYRTDFMHEVDFVEEVAIGYNYKNLPTNLFEGGYGQYHPWVKLQNKVRNIIVGAGYLETMNFMLISKENYADMKMPYDDKENIVIDNPVSLEYNTTRSSLMPVLMRLLQFNRSEEKPIRIFEVGDVIKLEPKEANGSRQELHICALTHHLTAEFTEIRGLFDFLVQCLGIQKQTVIKASENPTFIPGRSGAIFMDNKKIGQIGEIHPEVLGNFGLIYPTAIFEMDLTPLLKEIRIE